jgi:hypothetical protein
MTAEVKKADYRDRPEDELLVEEHPSGPEQSGHSILIKVTLAVCLGVGVYLLPTPENLSPEGHRFLALLLAIVILWVTEAIPIGVSALVAAAGLILFGIQSPGAAWAPFASPAVMFVLMIVMFGVVLNEVGLANRIMYYVFKMAGTGVKKLSFVLAVGCTMMATVFHDATVTVIMIFALVPVFVSMGITPLKSNNLSKFFIILIPLASSAGGFGTLLGGGRNPLAVEILQSFTNGKVTVGFMEYIVIQFPLAFLTAVATWGVLWLIFRPKEKELPAEVMMDKMPPMRGKELGVTIIFTLTFIMWTLSDLTGWHVSVVAALALAGFCGPKFISFKTICDKFPWESWYRLRRRRVNGRGDVELRSRPVPRRSLPAASRWAALLRRLLWLRLLRIVPVEPHEQLGGGGPHPAHHVAHGRNDEHVAPGGGAALTDHDLLHHAGHRLPADDHRLQHGLLQPDRIREGGRSLVSYVAARLHRGSSPVLAHDRILLRK